MPSHLARFLAAFIGWTLLAATATFAQDRIALRASHQASFLPEGTQIVVLSRPARGERAGRMQPEFIGRGDYPNRAELVYRRDVLTENGFSGRLYERTKASGALYFLYALTPDSTLYWSYSAQRDSLKFDVVSTGVMSVAPVLVSDVRTDVLRRFFRQRVVVHMPDSESERGVKTITDSLADSTGVQGKTPTDVAPIDTTERRAAASSSVPPVASAASPSAHPESSSTSNDPLGLPAAIVAGLIAAGSLVYARTQRDEARRLRLQLITVKDDPSGDQDALQRELEELRGAQRELRQEYADLQKHYAQLENHLAGGNLSPRDRRSDDGTCR